MAQKRAKKSTTKTNTSLSLKEIQPLTNAQQQTFDQYDDDQNLVLYGTAGTGKTFLSMYLALDQVLNQSVFKKVVIVRSVVPSRDIGFLPGSVQEKSALYEAPYQMASTELFGRADCYSILKTKQIVEFTTTSFVRGITWNDCIVIVDEMQNMSFQELNSIITRVGTNCKIIFCGDIHQDDLSGNKGQASGFFNFIKIIERMSEFSMIRFTVDDIVRSGLVKSYIIAKEQSEYGSS